jgi:hypothetical protein
MSKDNDNPSHVVFVGFYMAHVQQLEALLDDMKPALTHEQRQWCRRGFTLGYINTARGLGTVLNEASRQQTGASIEMLTLAYLREAEDVRKQLQDILGMPPGVH